MEAKELRIGNYYKYFDGTINGYRYSQITLRDFAYIGEADGDFKHYGFNPIPLTEEWLLKFGFEKKDLKHTDGSISKGLYYNYPCVVDKARLSDDDEYSFCRLVPGGINKYNFFTHFKYVHQLQNLYFVLTGKELKFTL